MRPLLLVAALMLAACGPSGHRDDASTSAAAPRSSLPADVDCATDDDCALLPIVTCCGECPPVPPFDVGTRENLDALLIESEERCAHDTRACAPPVCERLPRGCFARAACRSGRCVVDSEGCPAISPP